MKLGTLLLAMGLCVSAQNGADKMLGTWKGRADKSIPPDETIALVTNVVTMPAPSTFKTVSEQVMKSGEKRRVETVLVCDGQDHASQNTNAQNTTSICDPKSGNFAIKRDGKVVMDVKREFSEDGKLMTFRRHRLDPNTGEWIDDVRVWERQ